MEAPPAAPRLHKCAACFKQFKQKAVFLQHIQRAGHSSHEPRCGSCAKHCRCLDALREHLLGSLAKQHCAEEFAKRGCSLCLNFFESAEELIQHRASCQLQASSQPAPVLQDFHLLASEMPQLSVTNNQKRVQAPRNLFSEQTSKGDQMRAVALDCEMVGGGQDGSLDLCARVCVVDEDENVLLDTYVNPQLPITDYRFEFTGIRAEDLAGALPIKQVRDGVEKILYDGTKSWATVQTAKLLVGHSLCHDLSCLGIEYPEHLQRDTAYYPPLLKTSNLCNKLQYLTKTYLGYTIQEHAAHDPYEDAVASMRLYRRMRMAAHPCIGNIRELLSMKKKRELESMNPEALLELCVPRFQCWCLDP